MDNVLGVILARGGSKGIKNKNICIVRNHPLIAYSIAAAKKSKYITDIIVSTDSVEIADVAVSYGASVPFMRPDELAGDKVISVDALYHAVIETERLLGKTYGYIVELPCVSPLRDHTHIDEALEKLDSTGCDSVISVVNTGEKHPIRLKKIVDDRIYDICKEYPEPNSCSRRQDLKPESFIRNGAIYSMKKDILLTQKSRHGDDSRPYIMPAEKSINIDEPLDLKIADFLVANGFCNNSPSKVKSVYEINNTRLPSALVTTPTYYINGMEKRLAEFFSCTFAPRANKSVLIDLIEDAEVLICQPCPEYKIDSDILKKANKLRVVASTSTGTNHIDVDYCDKNNISVVCLRGSSKVNNIVASSEFTFGLVLSTVRQIPQSFDNVKAGRWREDEDIFRGIELRGKSMGIIGYGRIGSNNARYAKAFGMKVWAYDPYVTITDPDVIQRDSVFDILENSDVLMVCVHISESTRGMVSDRWFDCMQNGVFFINTSRGEIVDENALIKNLKSGKVAAAGLDVISNEFTGDKNTHPLIEYARNNSNLIITPHIAGLTYDSERKAIEIVLGEIRGVLSE